MAKEEDQQIYLGLFKGILGELSAASTDVLLNGARDLLTDDEVKKYFEQKKIQPYVYLSGLLNLLGREMTEENMSTVIKSVGIAPDKQMISALLNANNENGVIYMYAIYFLAILGKDRNVKNICDLVKALGVEPNQALARKELDLAGKRLEKK
ncbi:MAG TPA: hypothetical protein VL945_00195 [Candidatus Saccharimonadales bacterium]|nr:hypothetical protein [Candidatus Saccharimonadales bacterium]